MLRSGRNSGLFYTRLLVAETMNSSDNNYKYNNNNNNNTIVSEESKNNFGANLINICFYEFNTQILRAFDFKIIASNNDNYAILYFLNKRRLDYFDIYSENPITKKIGQWVTIAYLSDFPKIESLFDKLPIDCFEIVDGISLNKLFRVKKIFINDNNDKNKNKNKNKNNKNDENKNSISFNKEKDYLVVCNYPESQILFFQINSQLTKNETNKDSNCKIGTNDDELESKESENINGDHDRLELVHTIDIRFTPEGQEMMDENVKNLQKKPEKSLNFNQFVSLKLEMTKRWRWEVAKILFDKNCANNSCLIVCKIWSKCVAVHVNVITGEIVGYNKEWIKLDQHCHLKRVCCGEYNVHTGIQQQEEKKKKDENVSRLCYIATVALADYNYGYSYNNNNDQLKQYYFDQETLHQINQIVTSDEKIQIDIDWKSFKLVQPFMV